MFTLAQNWLAHRVQSSLSLTYKTLQSQKPSYLYNLHNLQANTSIRSSTVIALQRPPPPVNSRLKITDRSFTYHAPAFWNILPKVLRYPLSHTSSTYLAHSTNHHLLAFSASQFHSKRRLISSTNHSRLSLHAPLHSRFTGSLNLALFSFHIIIVIIVSLMYHTYNLISLLYGLLSFKSSWK